MNQTTKWILVVGALGLTALGLLALIMVILVVGPVQPFGPTDTPTPAGTRTISGMVRDAVTLQAIPQAQVQTGSTSVSSDESGTFAIPLPPGAALHVSATGYEGQDVQPTAETVLIELVRTPQGTYELVHAYQIAGDYGRQYDLLHPDVQALFSRDDYVRYMEQTVDYVIVARSYGDTTILPSWAFMDRTYTDVAQVPFTLTIERGGAQQAQSDVGHLARANGMWRWFRGPIGQPTVTPAVWPTITPALPTAGPAPFPVGSWVEVNVANLNLRAGPGTGYAVVTTVSYGTRLQVAAGPTVVGADRWYQVTDGGAANGWCNGRYLAASTPVTPTPTTGPVFPVGSWVMVSSPDGRLNIRQGPGLGYAVVAVLNNGTRLRILGGPVPADSASWYEVTDEAGKVRGWCEGRYLVSTTPPATITPTIGPVFPVGSWVQVSSPSGRLNIRQGPGTNYAVIAVANNGTRLRIVGGPTVVGGVPWYEVVNDPQTYQGWCSGQYLTPVGPPPPTITPTSQPDFPPGTWVLVSSPDGQLNIRSGPGSQYSILRSVPNGTRLRVVQGPTWVEGAPWYLVTDEGQTFTGWCNGRYLVLAPVTPTSTVEPTFPVGTWVQVASPDGQLNIRSGPGPSYPVLYTAHNGDLLVIAGGPQWVSGDPWYNVSGPPGSTPGWCNGRYLVLAAPTPVPTQGPGAGQFTELQFCVIPPGGGEADCSGNFASPVYEVRIVWDYVNMQSGMTVRREWYFNGQHLNTVDEPWDYARYGAQGTVWDVRMWDNQGLDPGDYRLILYLNNVKQQERGFTIARR